MTTDLLFLHCSNFSQRRLGCARTADGRSKDTSPTDQRSIQQSSCALPTSSKLFTSNPLAFITGFTCAANALSSCLASSSAAASVVGNAVIKLMCGFGFVSRSLIRRWTMISADIHYPEEYERVSDYGVRWLRAKCTVIWRRKNASRRDA